MVAVLALLGAVDDEAVPAELRRRARDGSKWTRQRAMEKLAALDEEEAWELVVRGLADPKGEVADTAQLVLGAMDEEQELARLTGKQGLRSKDEWVRRRVAEVFGRCARPVSAEHLLRALRDRDAEVRRMAAWSVERLARADRLRGREELRAFLERRAQSERDDGCRGRMVIALAALVEEPETGEDRDGASGADEAGSDPLGERPGAREALRVARSAAKDASTHVRSAAAHALAQEALLDQQVLGTLAQLACDEAPGVRWAALDALAARGSRDAFQHLIERLAEETEERLARRLVSLLQRASGRKHRRDPRPWRDWHALLPEDWRAPRGNAGGSDERPVRDAAVTTSARFAGLPILSQNVAFLIDLSGSMWTPGENGRLPKDEVGEALEQALRALPETTHFQLVTYTEQPRAWKRSAVPATRANVRAALAFYERAGERGTGNFWDAAMLALEDPTIDTLCVLTDGAPTGGRRHRLELIVPLYEERHQLRACAVDSILVDATSRLQDFWDDLARRTGGRSLAIEGTGP